MELVPIGKTTIMVYCPKYPAGIQERLTGTWMKSTYLNGVWRISDFNGIMVTVFFKKTFTNV